MVGASWGVVYTLFVVMCYEANCCYKLGLFVNQDRYNVSILLIFICNYYIGIFLIRLDITARAERF